jgi:hypothetical protein
MLPVAHLWFPFVVLNFSMLTEGLSALGIHLRFFLEIEKRNV